MEQRDKALRQYGELMKAHPETFKLGGRTMKAKGVPQGLPEHKEICGRCETTEDVHWVAYVASGYTFSGYFCKDCESERR